MLVYIIYDTTAIERNDKGYDGEKKYVYNNVCQMALFCLGMKQT